MNGSTDEHDYDHDYDYDYGLQPGTLDDCISSGQDGGTP
jgi:hypothetical protein